MNKPSFSVVSVICVCVVALLIMTSQAASARPKSVTGDCTKAQLDKYKKSKDGKKCTAQGDNDVLSNSKVIHGIYCSSSGKVLCCAYDEKGIVAGSCETIKQLDVPFTPRPSMNVGPKPGKAESISNPGSLE